MRSRLPDENTRADIVGVGSGERPGGEVIGISGDRQTVIGDGVSKRIILKKGPNIVRAAVINGGGATDFCALFLDADDKPMRGFTASLTEARK